MYRFLHHFPNYLSRLTYFFILCLECPITEYIWKLKAPDKKLPAELKSMTHFFQQANDRLKKKIRKEWRERLVQVAATILFVSSIISVQTLCVFDGLCRYPTQTTQALDPAVPRAGMAILPLAGKALTLYNDNISGRMDRLKVYD